MSNEKDLKFHDIDQPDDLTEREKEDAMGSYLMMFASIGAGLPLPFINLIASLIYFYINKDKSRYVRFHTYQSMMSQLPVTLMNSSLVIWASQIWFWSNIDLTNQFWSYLIVVVIINIGYLIFSLIAAIKARKGKMYYFIFFGKWAYIYAYKISDEKAENNYNKAPKL